MGSSAHGWRCWGSTIWCSDWSDTPCSTSSSRIEDPMYGKGLRTLAITTVITLAVAFALVFFYAPLDADQGFIQKIFYLHVPLAIVALVGFVVGGVYAIRHLQTGDLRHDARSYVCI